MKRIALLVVVVVGAAACGDGGLLDGLGERSQVAVYGGTTTTVTTVVPVRAEAPLGLLRSSDLAWYNDGIAGEGTGIPAQVIAAVWSRGDGVSSVIQSSRTEIALALPGIQFPEVVPDTVGWVTSQLVYDVASGTLGADTSAQFGLWQSEPYASEGGRSAVMRVRPVTSIDIVGSIIPESTPDGLSLSWVAEAYQYRLFCPTGLLEDYCWQMAETAMPLSLLLPST